MPSELQYANYLEAWLRRGYTSRLMGPDDPETEGALYLRHDIDFDCQLAQKAARLENELGVASTFFFLLSSDSYNLLSRENRAVVESIIDLGHKVSLHFDPLLYDDIHAGLRYELEIFRRVFDVPADIISIHRPASVFLNNPDAIDGVAHTYQPRFMERIKYFSDSQGRFRFGDPLMSEEFSRGATVQLLLHPIWWFTGPAQRPQNQVESFIISRMGAFSNYIQSSCKAFDERALARRLNLAP